jgi:hypothetical protein
MAGSTHAAVTGSRGADAAMAGRPSATAAFRNGHAGGWAKDRDERHRQRNEAG